MAVAKKPVTRGNAPGSSNPNTILVVFLVLFVLISIGLGAWGYYGYAGQEDLKKAAITKSVEAKSNKQAADVYAFGLYEALLAMGQELDADTLNDWDTARPDFIKEEGRFKGEAKIRPLVIKLMQDARADLASKTDPGYDDANKKYSPTYKQKINKLMDDLKVANAAAGANQIAAAGANEQYTKLTALHDNFHKQSFAMIQKGNAEALAAAKAGFKAMDEALDQNQKLREQITNLTKEWELEKDKLERDVLAYKNKYDNALAAKAAPPAANPAKAEGTAEPHALFLDISTGKPLWDSSVGEIVRVIDERQVVINLGSDDGVKPQLTFNVFIARGRRPDRELKGTIEVVRTINAHSSVAQITAQTNAKDFPIKAGDQLFNCFFGAHVAVAGQVNWFAAGGARGESPEEQARSLSQFMQLLQRQGVIIDAYIDVSNGSIKGAINSGTRYLIMGGKLYMKEVPMGKDGMDKEKDMEKEKDDKGKDADKEKEKDKEADKEKEKEKEKDGDKEKEPEKKDAPEPRPMPDAPNDEALRAMNAKRIQLANESMKVMFREAVENGCFIVSASNFAHIAGYRRLLTTAMPEEPVFRPTLPSANVAPVIPGVPPPPPPKPNPPPEKKDE